MGLVGHVKYLELSPRRDGGLFDGFSRQVMRSGSTLISLVAVWGVDYRHEAVNTGRRVVAQERGFWWLRPGRWQRRWKGLDDFE